MALPPRTEKLGLSSWPSPSSFLVCSSCMVVLNSLLKDEGGSEAGDCHRRQGVLHCSFKEFMYSVNAFLLLSLQGSLVSRGHRWE